MKVYLDTCSLHRPLDNRTQLRVALEAEAVLGVLAMCEAGQITLVSSEILSLEIDRNPQPERKSYVTSILDIAQVFVAVDRHIEERAKALEQRTFKAIDALHIASAESCNADWFCTCDDRVLRKSRQQPDLAVKVVSPLELANEIAP
jgi:hypothetical protein